MGGKKVNRAKHSILPFTLTSWDLHPISLFYSMFSLTGLLAELYNIKPLTLI